MSRKQCDKCPWKVSTNPHDIPDGYAVEKHEGLKKTMGHGIASLMQQAPMMACHEFDVGTEMPCVGWLDHQLGRGNNIGLRLAVMQGKVDGDYETDGEQHKTFEDTLP